MNKFLACLVLIVVLSSAQGFSIWEKTKMILIHGWEHIIKPDLKKMGEHTINELKETAIGSLELICLGMEEDKNKARCLAVLKMLNII